MFSKIVIACALVAMCAASYHHHHAPAVSYQSVIRHDQPIHHGHGGHHHEHHDEYAYPKYAFKYSVEDPHTGDHKSQHESRDGDVVKGEYSLLQPDGSFRKVTYRADHHSGFQAHVHNTPPVIYHH